MQRGDTFLLSAGPQGWRHLWVVATQPLPATSETVIVSVTTLRNSADQTTILRKGDHPFIRHDSVVHFEDARVVTGSEIDAEIKRGSIQRGVACSHELIEMVSGGLWASPFTPKKIIRFMEEHL